MIPETLYLSRNGGAPELEYKKIAYFIAVAETLSFTRAAERMFVSQQTITKQIAQLEEELGVRLLDRTTRSVSLTPSGKLCYERFSVINAEIDAAVSEIRRADAAHQQQISVGFFSSFSADSVIQPVMRKLREVAPDVDFVVHLYDMFELQDKFFAGELDMCVTTTSNWRSWRDVSVTRIVSEPFYIVLSASHPLASKKTLAEDDLKNETFFRLKNADGMSSGDYEPPMRCRNVELLDNFSTLKTRLDLAQGFSALTRVFEGAYDPRFVYFPMPSGKEQHAEIVCAYHSDDKKSIIISLAAALEELELHFDN